MFDKLFLAALLTCLATTAGHALDPTPPQIEGPYYPKRKPAETDSDLTRIGNGPQAQGEVLVLNGGVADPEGKAIAGAIVEIWQTDHQGIYAHPRDPRTAKRDPAFQGYGTTTASETGAFSFRTIVPGRYEGRPAHIHVKVTPPGGRVVTTQLYIKDDPDLARDGIARDLGKALERVMLAPVRSGGAGGPLEASITLVVKRGR